MNLTAVQLDTSDPFAPGATPGRVVIANGSDTNASYSFGDVAHGDFCVVAWKDNLDGVVGSGDPRGWYEGAVNGAGAPVAKVLHLLHGQGATIDVTVSPIPSPQNGPGGGPAPTR